MGIKVRRSVFLIIMMLIAAFAAVDAAYATDSTAPVINHLSIQNADAIDGQGEMTVELDITEDGSGVSNIYMTFSSFDKDNPGFEQFPTVSVRLFENRNGQSVRSLFTGKHTLSVSLTSDAVSNLFRNGNYTLQDISLGDNDNNGTYYFPNQLDFCDTTEISVINSPMADSTPPIINSITIKNPDNVDAADGIYATVDLTEVGSGVTNITFSIRDEQYNYYYSFAYFQEPLFTGVHDIKIHISDPIKTTGKYYISSAYAIDKSANQKNLSDPDKITGAELTITRIPDYIEQTTRLNKISIEQNALETPNVLNLNVDTYDSGSGVSILSITFRNKDTSGKPLFLSWTCWDDAGGNRLGNGEHTLRFTISPFVPAGEYVLEEVQIGGSDNTIYSPDTYGEALVPVEGDPELTITSPFDVSYFGSIENDAALDEIKKLDNDGVAVIDCRRIKTVPDDYFEAIAGTNKTVVFEDEDVQWIFHGQSIDLSRCKDIDLQTNIYVASGAEQGFDDDEQVLVVQFADNGELPGEADVRVNNAYISAKYAAGDMRMILSYVNNENEISVEDEEVDIEADEAAVLEIDHNSTFVLSKNKPRKNTTPADDDPQDTIKVGDKKKINGDTYKITSTKNRKVSFIAAKNRKSVTVPATIKVSDQIYKVTDVGAKAFTSSKIHTVTVGKNVNRLMKNAFRKSGATKIILKTKGLKESTVKGSLSGSKVNTIKISIGSKKVNNTYVKKYRKIFTKSIVGRKATVQ